MSRLVWLIRVASCLVVARLLLAGGSASARTIVSESGNGAANGVPWVNLGGAASDGSGPSGSGPADQTPAPTGLNKINHFVFILQENRSFDAYFGTYPGADGIPAGVCVADPFGGCVAPYHNPQTVNRGGPHDWSNALSDINTGGMDGFVTQAYSGVSMKGKEPCLPPKLICAPGRDPRDVMGYHDYHEIPNYWNYAHLYVLQDHMFAPVTSYTLPNRLYMLAGQSDGLMKHSQTIPKVFDYPQVTQLLSGGNVSWKYYVTPGKQPDTADARIVGSGSAQVQTAHLFTLFNPLPRFAWIQDNPTQSSRLVDTTQFYTDAASGDLPQVSWVIPNDAVSEHPPSDIRAGMAYVTGLVNAVMGGPDWDSTAIFISYDEWGGFYDHVTPPVVDQYGYGLRVPGLVISPYARQGYVDHNVYSTDSWLKLIEERYDLPALTARDRNAADMLSDFDFAQSPRPPVLLAATPQGTPYPYPYQATTDPKPSRLISPSPKAAEPRLPGSIALPVADNPSSDSDTSGSAAADPTPSN
jgi:phospholipase C